MSVAEPKEGVASGWGVLARRLMGSCRQLAGWLVLAALTASCVVPQQGTGEQRASGEEAQLATPKRISLAVTADLPTMDGRLNSPLPGSSSLDDLTTAGLAKRDPQWVFRPQLADAVPSIENGLWRVFPDGRMETTWRLASGARWHDGRSLTTDDLRFTLRLAGDKERAEFYDPNSKRIEAVEAVDARTLRVTWREPFIDADGLFARSKTLPLPAHLLEDAYGQGQVQFTALPYWTDEYVGSGPFRLRNRVPGSHVVLEAFDAYVLGRPKIDEVELRFIPDANVVYTAFLAGSLDAVVGRSLSLEQGLQLRDQWREGEIDFRPARLLAIYPQFLDANAPIIANVQFRRALLHAIDRQSIVETLQAGLAPVAHSFLEPGLWGLSPYAEIEAAVPRYGYDPRRATQLLESLGYARASDGTLRAASNQRPSFEIRTFVGDINEKSMLASADSWRRLGLAVEAVVVPTARQRDAEYMTTFPGFRLQGGGNMQNFHSSQASLPANNYAGSGANASSRYMHPEYDALLDRYLVTIPMEERTRALGQVIYHLADQVVGMPLFYSVEPLTRVKTLQNVTSGNSSGSETWNVHEWDLAR